MEEGIKWVFQNSQHISTTYKFLTMYNRIPKMDNMMIYPHLLQLSYTMLEELNMLRNKQRKTLLSK